MHVFKLRLSILIVSLATFCIAAPKSNNGPASLPEQDLSRGSRSYQPPLQLLKPIETNPRTLISGGPPNPYHAPQIAFQNPQMAMFENTTLKVNKYLRILMSNLEISGNQIVLFEKFKKVIHETTALNIYDKIIEDIKDGLRYLFQTENPYTLALTGTGHSAMEAVLNNIVEPGDVVLVPISGVWTERVTEIASSMGATVKHVKTPRFGKPFTIDEIEAAIKETQPDVVYIVNGESSTAMFQDIRGVGKLCRKYDCILIVDVVASLNIIPFYFDKWMVDAAFCNSQKGIGAPVGLAPVTFGPRAVSKILNRKTKITTYFNDMALWIENNYWNLNPAIRQKPLHSYPLLLYYTLREALAISAATTVEKMWAKYERITNQFYEEFKDIPLKYYVPDPKDRLTGTIAFYPPKGVSARDFAHYIEEKYDMEISIGMGPTYNKIVRVAFLAKNADPVVVHRAIEAIKDAVNHFRLKAPKI